MIVVPNGSELSILTKTLNENHTIKLYSNDLTPDETTTVGSLVEVSGGGYVSGLLLADSWIFTPGNPCIAMYAAQNLIFTGPTDSPGTIYGYYVIRLDGSLAWIERFPEAVLPFTPGAGSLIRITPRLELS